MRALPVADPGTPDISSPTRYLLWLARGQISTIVGGMVWGIVWMVSQALIPAALGRAIDRGVAAHDGRQLLLWGGIMFGLGAVQAVTNILRHRRAVSNFQQASYRTVQVVARHAVQVGDSLSRHMAAGEVVSVGTSDIHQIGNGIDITARTSGAIVAIIAVTVILLTASLPLGLVVVLGVPVLLAVVGMLIGPLHRHQRAYRHQVGTLTSRATDIVAGLRVLRGVGGEASFARRYRDHSQTVRAAGVRVARVESFLEAAQFLLPGVFVVLVTWLGARFAVDGRISPGQLVAFYGYATFLVFPLRTITEAVDLMTRAHVAAGRVIAVLSVTSDLAEPDGADVKPVVTHGDLIDATSGVVITPGRLTALAASDPRDAAAIADRLGRYADGDVTLAGVPLSTLNRTTVREQILVADNDAKLFSGVMRETLASGDDTAPGDAELWAALEAASATDIVDALPGGLDEQVAERGREFSGGQQQRLRLARALIADPPILILIEPTSAVDAHTEARIADRLRLAREGRTTVVASTSPLVLDRVDRVIYIAEGKAVADGTHRELLATEPRYAATVTRGES